MKSLPITHHYVLAFDALSVETTVEVYDELYDLAKIILDAGFTFHAKHYPDCLYLSITYIYGRVDLDNEVASEGPEAKVALEELIRRAWQVVAYQARINSRKDIKDA